MEEAAVKIEKEREKVDPEKMNEEFLWITLSQRNSLKINEIPKETFPEKFSLTQRNSFPTQKNSQKLKNFQKNHKYLEKFPLHDFLKNSLQIDVYGI